MAILKDKYTKEQLILLQQDIEFQNRISTDEELVRLFDPSRDEEELYASYQSLGGCLFICNVKVKPPTLGSIRLLSLVNSPFVSSKPDWSEPYFSLTECIYILVNGADALDLESGYFIWKDRLAYYKQQATDIKNTAWMDKVLDAEAKLAGQKAKWITKVSKWADENEVRIDVGETISSVIKLLNSYISTAFNGFNMFPSTVAADGSKEGNRQVFDNEGEANALALVNEVATIGVEEARWGIPLITLGHMAAAGGKKVGIKAIGRKPKAEECFERLNKLMDERLKELGK